MRPGNFNNKFSQYLQNKINPEKRKELFRGQFDSEHEQEFPSSVYPFSALNQRNSCISRSSQPSEQQSNTLRLSQFEYERQKEKTQMGVQEPPIQRKRLKKLRELQENQCGICLDQIKKQCQLKCKHKFCFSCLQNWFQKSNKCPYCRAESQSFWYKGNQFLVEPKQQDGDSDFSEDSQWNEQEPQVDAACYNCEETKVGDTVLICDRCQVSVCHVECDQTLFGVMPEGEWYCHFCR